MLIAIFAILFAASAPVEIFYDFSIFAVGLEHYAALLATLS